MNILTRNLNIFLYMPRFLRSVRKPANRQTLHIICYFAAQRINQHFPNPILATEPLNRRHKDGKEHEEAQKLIAALPSDAGKGGSPAVSRAKRGVSPQKLSIPVAKNAKTNVNIRIPFFLERAGLRPGRSLGSISAKHCRNPEEARGIEILNKIDIDEILAGIEDDEAILPITIVDVDDAETGETVKIMIQ